jgi:hypothetical protein
MEAEVSSKFQESVELQNEIAELRRALKTSQLAESRSKIKSQGIIDAVYRAAKDASLATGNARRAPALPKKDVRKGKTEVALVHATDWQCGKKTQSYDIATLSQRMEEFANKVLELTDIQRAHHPVKECVLMFGGDMVEGVSIFPGQAYEIEAHLFEQLFEVSRIMEQMVRTFSAYFEKVHVVCEYGNHGRLGRKGDMPGGDNIDRVAYKITSERTSDLKNVTWQQSGDWHQIVTVGKYRALLVHGDEINSFGGNTPAFGILRKCNAWSTGVVDEFQDVYMGHFHTPMTLTMANAGRIFVSGSPESHNEYARAFIAAVGQPSQRLHFVDPVKGRVTAEYTCWL